MKETGPIDPLDQLSEAALVRLRAKGYILSRRPEGAWRNCQYGTCSRGSTMFVNDSFYCSEHGIEAVRQISEAADIIDEDYTQVRDGNVQNDSESWKQKN